LRLNLPKFATPENAIKVLEYLRENQLPAEGLSSEVIEKV
jgi:hypothetical protein